MIFLDLPTELLCRILSYLPALDLCAAQRTCRRINRIITDTVYFQYVLRAYINGVDDLLPPDCPFHERLELLRHYEKPWNNLQLNISAEFPISTEAPSAHYDQASSYYTLQDGYLIYKLFKERQLGIPCRYGYLDLLSAIGNKEASWVHILMQDPDMDHLDLIFAADHDLAISFRFCIPSSAFLGAIPDKVTAHGGWPMNVYLHNTCLRSLSLQQGTPIPSPQGIP